MGRQFCNFASCSLTVRRECGLRVLENRVLREVFRRKGKEVLAYRRSVRNEGLVLYVDPELALR